MENKDEYLNEEKFQKTNKKVNGVGMILLIIGGIMLVGGLVMSFGFHKLQFGIFSVIGLALVGFGGQAKLLGNARNIQAYMTQQGMPIAQEGMKKMAPTAGVAAKEIAKGIKEGLKEDNVIYCKHCGEPIDADSTFCKKCGKQL